MGLGIHGEPGAYKQKLAEAHCIVGDVRRRILNLSTRQEVLYLMSTVMTLLALVQFCLK